MLYESIADLVGNTPLVRLRTGIPENGLRAYVKLEYNNPTGSVKDRMAYFVIKNALDKGELKKGDTVIDNTSGNTGSAVAMFASVFGLKSIITTPKKTSQEKIDLIRSYGAEIIITPTEASHDDPEGCYMMARNLAKENNYFDINQYDSQANVEAHYNSTGPEIWEQTEGKISHFVCGIGTGGTMSGTSRFLKEQNKDIVIVAVDTEGSVLSDYIKGNELPEPQLYKIEGIGSDALVKALHKEHIDFVYRVSDKDAFIRAREITRAEGIFGGGSSGAVACIMEKVAQDLTADSFMVGMFSDGGIRYLSKCYNDNWMKENGFL